MLSLLVFLMKLWGFGAGGRGMHGWGDRYLWVVMIYDDGMGRCTFPVSTYVQCMCMRPEIQYFQEKLM